MEKILNDLKQRTHAEETYDSETFMKCINTIPSTSNTLKNLVVNKILHYSYIKTEFNDEKKMIINIFSGYVFSLLKYINHPAFPQEWKTNLDSAPYEKYIDANIYKISDKK